MSDETKPAEAQAEAAKSPAVEPVSSELTIKGAGVPDSDGAAPATPESKDLALSTPRPDVPVAVSVVGEQNTHNPPDLRYWDTEGRIRTK